MYVMHPDYYSRRKNNCYILPKAGTLNVKICMLPLGRGFGSGSGALPPQKPQVLAQCNLFDTKNHLDTIHMSVYLATIANN